MLEAISWKEYGLMMGAAIGLYYGWWVVRYAPSLGWQWPWLKVQESGGRMAELYVLPEGEGKQAKNSGAKREEGAATSVLPVPAVIEKPMMPAGLGTGKPAGARPAGDPILLGPMLAGGLMKEIHRLVERAVDEKMPEREVVFAVQRLLTDHPWRQLRGTGYWEKVTNRVVCVLEKVGSIRLDASVVKGLWDG